MNRSGTSQSGGQAGVLWGARERRRKIIVVCGGEVTRVAGGVGEGAVLGRREKRCAGLDDQHAGRVALDVADVARRGTIRQPDHPPVDQLEAAHIQRIGAAMLGELSAGNAVAPAAIIGVEIVDLAEPAAGLLA